MIVFVISDNTDTYTGMRLAGADGAVVHDADALHAELERAISSGAGVILATEKARSLDPAAFDDARVKPLVLIIPDRHGTAGESIAEYVKKTIG